MKLAVDFHDGLRISAIIKTFDDGHHTYRLEFTDGSVWEGVRAPNVNFEEDMLVVRVIVLEGYVRCVALKFDGKPLGMFRVKNDFKD